MFADDESEGGEWSCENTSTDLDETMCVDECSDDEIFFSRLDDDCDELPGTLAETMSPKKKATTAHTTSAVAAVASAADSAVQQKQSETSLNRGQSLGVEEEEEGEEEYNDDTNNNSHVDDEDDEMAFHIMSEENAKGAPTLLKPDNHNQNSVPKVERSTIEPIVITGSARRTKRVITKFEIAALIGERATIIEQGKAFDMNPEFKEWIKSCHIHEALTIATLEINSVSARKCINLCVWRCVGTNKYEIWKLDELIFDIASSIYTHDFEFDHERTKLLRLMNGSAETHSSCRAFPEYPIAGF
jgi:hypothetical protein